MLAMPCKPRKATNHDPRRNNPAGERSWLLQRNRRERIKQAELSAAWSRHETLLVGVSLELTGAFDAR